MRKAPMVNLSWRLKAIDLVTSSLIGVLVLLVVGCAGPPPEQSPPPPMASAEAAPPVTSPDLAGGPPAAPTTPTESAEAPPPASHDDSASMAPIPNPEDLAPPERARVYGHRYDRGAVSATAPLAPAAVPHHQHQRRTTHVWNWNNHAGARRALRHLHPAQPARAALRPSEPAPAAPAKTAATPTERLTQLQVALRGPVADRSGFSVSDDLAAGKPGAVTLTLPPDLFARVRSEAAKVGLARATQRFDLVATLSGDGYAITPIVPQSLTAPAPGAPPPSALPAFIWQVQPQAGGAAGPLKAELSAQLKGAGAALALPLLSLERSAKPVQTAEPAPAAETDPLRLGALDVPGLGKVPVSSILAVILLILVVAVLVAAARHTAERDRAERRKARIAARTAMAAAESARPTATTETTATRTETARNPELV